MTIASKNVEGKNLSVQKMSTRKGKPVDKNYTFSDYADLWSLVKNKRRNKRSKKTTRCCEKKKITELDNRLNPDGPEKRMNLKTK